jgi:hypothetical protein
VKNLVFALSLLGIAFYLGFPSRCDAAIAFRSKTFAWDNHSVSSFTATEPTGAAQNDILLMFALISGSPTITPPTGWSTAISYLAGSTDLSIRVFWIRRGSSAPNYTVSINSATNYYEVSVSAWSGVVTSGTPFDAATNATPTSRNPSDPNCPSVTTTVANTVVIAMGIGWNGWNTTESAPTGYTLVEGGINGDHNDSAVAYIAKASAGTEDPPAFSGAIGGSGYVAEVTLALTPNTGGSTPVRHKVIMD